MDFVFSRYSFNRGTSYWHYIPSSGYIAEQAETIEVVSGCFPNPENPGRSFPTIYVYHIMKNQMLPDFVNVSYSCTDEFRTFVLNNWHNRKLITSLFGSRFDSLIRQVVNDEYNSIREEISKNIPEVVGFSVLHFRSRKVVLVHDLTEGAKYPIIDVVSVRSSKTDGNKESVRSFLERLYEKAGEAKMRKIKIIIPFNYDLYLSARCINDDNGGINICIPAASKGPNCRQLSNPYKGVVTINNEMACYVNGSYNIYYNEVLRRHQIISSLAMPKSVDSLRKMLILLF